MKSRAPQGVQWRVSALLIFLALVYWGRVLLPGHTLLPGDFLRGFAPFGNDGRAPWSILQWDALGQYFPWRHFAAQKLQSGQIPLWNPYQFSGTPFLANAQSAVFYLLNIPFLVFNTAYAFGWSALLGSLVALFGTYLLARLWRMSRAAAVLSATAFAFCGFMSAWALLPTLFQSACWLPLCLYYFERAVEEEKPTRWTLALVASVAMAILAGHAQIFFYVVLALALRQPFLKRPLRGLFVGVGTLAFAGALCALQLLPTLELAANSPRVAAGGATSGAWQFVKNRALAISDLPSLAVPWPLQNGSFSENFGYMGVGVSLLFICSLLALRLPLQRRQRFYALTLAVFGLLYALATPLAQIFFFGVPGVAAMGGTGRALVLWSLGTALCAGFGFDWLRSKWRSPIVFPVALAVVAFELFGNAFATQPSSTVAQIYPQTQITDFLKQNSSRTARVWFQTDKRFWRPSEGFRGERAHPQGVLPPNGAMVYGIYDINGYDSLSLRGYRYFVSSSEEGGNPSPLYNGNMILLQTPSQSLLDTLSVRWVVTLAGGPAPENAQPMLTAEGCTIYRRALPLNTTPTGGEAFSLGAGGYTPEAFRAGVFISLCALSLWSALWMGSRSKVSQTRRDETVS